MAAQGGRSTVRSGKTTLGLAFIVRGLAGNSSRNPATGKKRSPGLIGSAFLVVFGGVFLGVGLYMHKNSATIQAQPGTKGSASTMAWICIAVGGLVALLGGLTLLNRIACLLIGIGLLIAGIFERREPVPVPVPAPPAAPTPAPGPAVHQTAVTFATGPGASASGPLLPPPIDPRLPGPGR